MCTTCFILILTLFDGMYVCVCVHSKKSYHIISYRIVLYHILSTLQKFPPPKFLRSDSRSFWISTDFFGFIIPDRIELYFFFFFLSVFFALTGTPLVASNGFFFKHGTVKEAAAETVARGLFLVVVALGCCGGRRGWFFLRRVCRLAAGWIILTCVGFG
jgi:hypothetical protein